jgi:DNA-binding NarL/FixJ family response regulator
MEKNISVLLIEDNRLLREGIAVMLSEQPGLKVVAATPGGEAALRQVRQAKPHVVLVSASLGDSHSLRLAQAAKEASPGVQVVVMAFPPALETVVEFMKLGVSGFIAEDATIHDFVRTIRSVTAGTHVLPPSLVEPLFSQVAHQAATEKEAQLHEAVRLTRRECQIIGMIREGLGNKEVAQRLDIATHTVKSHVHNILKKLGLHTRLQIAAYALNGKGSSKDHVIAGRSRTPLLQ